MIVQEIASGDARGYEVVRVLWREYAEGLGIDLAFEGFEEEMRSLPGKYGRPQGRLLIARDGSTPVGCAALRPLDGTRGEIKRLYVRAEHRRQGAARALLERLRDEARAEGYRALVLDSLPSMVAAQALYAKLGFREISAHRASPIGGTRYFSLRL